MHLPKMNIDDPGHRLGEHMLGSYTTLRLVLVVLAIAFPLVLWLGGEWIGVQRASSMSAYYFAARDEPTCVFFPMRPYLVGILCAICLGLYAYKGFTQWENLFLNLAAISGFVVALVPDNLLDYQIKGCGILRVVQDAQKGQPLWHDYASFAMFGFLAITALFFAHQSLKYLPEGYRQWKKWFSAAYILIAIAMIALPYVIYSMNTSTEPPNRNVFWMEMVAIYCFAGYWGLKSLEMHISKGEKLAARNIKPAEALAIPREAR